MAALHYCMVEWPGHHKLASAGSDNCYVCTDITSYIIVSTRDLIRLLTLGTF